MDIYKRNKKRITLREKSTTLLAIDIIFTTLEITHSFRSLMLETLIGIRLGVEWRTNISRTRWRWRTVHRHLIHPLSIKYRKMDFSPVVTAVGSKRGIAWLKWEKHDPICYLVYWLYIIYPEKICSQLSQVSLVAWYERCKDVLVKPR